MSNKKTHILVLWAKKAFRWGVQHTLDHTDTFKLLLDQTNVVL